MTQFNNNIQLTIFRLTAMPLRGYARV